MNKTIHFVSGLPRSGSTLLLNILGQNPRFHVTGTSGIVDVMYVTRNMFSEILSFQTMDEELLEKRKINALRGVLFGYYQDAEFPVVFDKSRGVEAHLEMIEKVFEARPKVIVCVRDVREVLASFERLYWKTKATRQLPAEKIMPYRYNVVTERCNQLLAPFQENGGVASGGIVGMEIERIKDAVRRGWRDSMLFVDYEHLTGKPSRILRDIYDFLGEPEFKHDFDNVQQITEEDDLVWTYKDLHKIRPKVEPQKEKTWMKILPEEYAGSIKDATFWKKFSEGYVIG